MRPSRRPADPFAVLGVAPGASRSEVRRAYRRRAMAIHPDVAPGGDDATAAMAELNAARDHLLGAALVAGRGAAGEPAAASGTDGPRAGSSHRPTPPGADHAPVWDDYWSAWNDLPRRPAG
jgi:molecular chaperone DnaJ